MISRPPSRPSLRTERHHRVYGPRILGALIASLIAITLTFRLWPATERTTDLTYVATPFEQIPLELIEPTQQAPPRAAPPPPPTLPPIEVPDDVPIPEEEIAFEPLDTAPTPIPDLPDAPPGPEETDGPETAAAFIERADIRPRTIGAPLPDYPREAERHDIRARIRIRVLIDERGRVQETEIVERLLLDNKDRETRVAEIGYGVEQAALDALSRTRFRPGRHGGRPVQTYTMLTFSVGV